MATGTGTTGLRSKTTTLHVHHIFCKFLYRLCTTTTWNDQILSLLENGNCKAINSIISVWTWARSPLFSFNLNSLLLSNSVSWDNRKIVWKDEKCIFQRHLNGRRRCRIVRSPFLIPDPLYCQLINLYILVLLLVFSHILLAHLTDSPKDSCSR